MAMKVTIGYNFFAQQHAIVLKFTCLRAWKINILPSLFCLFSHLPRTCRDQTAHTQQHDPRHRRRPAYRRQGLPYFAPAPANTGIVFRRIDLPRPLEIKADPYAIGDTRLSSCLEKNGERISTVEHLMSAFSGLGIDNAYVDITAPEVPIMDGSAGPFVFLLQSAGIEEQSAPKKFIRILQTVEARDGDKWVRFEPHNGFKLTLSIAFEHPVFDKIPQSVCVDFDDILREGSKPRAPSDSCRMWKPCGLRDSRSGAASTMRS